MRVSDQLHSSAPGDAEIGSTADMVHGWIWPPEATILWPGHRQADARPQLARRPQTRTGDVVPVGHPPGILSTFSPC